MISDTCVWWANILEPPVFRGRIAISEIIIKFIYLYFPKSKVLFMKIRFFKEHFSLILPLLHHQAAYTYSTLHQICLLFITNLQHFSLVLALFTTKLHIPIALFIILGSFSLPNCIYLQHFLSLLHLIHHQTAYTYNTLRFASFSVASLSICAVHLCTS